MNENENVKICKYCGEIIGENEESVFVYTQDDYIEVHKHCADENCFICEDCDCYYDNNIECFVTHYNERICVNCYEDSYCFCEHCGDLYHINDLSLQDNEYYCNSCFNDLYTTCENCGETILRDNANFDDDGCCYYCDDCYSEAFCNNRIYSYHDFSDWREFKTQNENENPYFIGFELEVEHRFDETDTLNQTLDILENNLNVIFMRDGSLNENGFEIISHPQTFNYLMENKNKYFEAFAGTVENGYISHDSSNCGLHFHFTAPSGKIRKEVIERIWIILETYKDEISKLSRRKGSFGYCNFLSNTSQLRNKHQDGLFYYIKKTDTHCDRYLALNDRNSKTIEFRFFKGTLNANTFFANLEFVNNIYNICCNLEIDLTTICWNDLIKGNFINKYCIENNILTDKKIVDNSLKYIELENKINRLITNISNILLKNTKKHFENLISNASNAKIKEFNKLCDYSYRYKENFGVFYAHLRNLRYLLDNTKDLASFHYYFNDSDTRRAFDFFLEKEDTEKIYKKYEKIKNYIEKLDKGEV